MSKKRTRGNGEGSIFKRVIKGKDVWVAQYKVGINPNGSSKYKTTYAKTRTDAKNKLEKLISEIKTGKYVEKSDVCLMQILKDNIDIEYDSNKISDSTYHRKKYTLSIINELDISQIPIQKLTASNINKSLSFLTRYSNSVINKVCQMLKSGLDTAIANNIINTSPFNIKGAIIKPKSIREDKKVDALNIEEQKSLVGQLSKNNDIYSDILHIALYTGMRVGEILVLKTDDVHFDNMLISITKTLTKDKNGKYKEGTTTKTYAGNREIPITNLILDTLKKYENVDGFLFLKDNKLIVPSTVNAHFKRICKNAKIRPRVYQLTRKLQKINLNTSNVNTHMLRHTYATRCIEAGVSAPVLQKLLGHKDIQTTINTYTTIFNQFTNTEVDKLISYIEKI